MDKKTEETLCQLIGALEALSQAHGQLLELLKTKRGALRTAAYHRVTEICEQENAIVQQISELEKHRLTVAADLTLQLDPDASQPMRMAELARSVEEPWRGQLLRGRQDLLERIAEVRHETSVARRATESLVTHMQGLMQTIGAVCSGVSVYGKHGGPPPTAMAVSTFSTTA